MKILPVPARRTAAALAALSVFAAVPAGAQTLISGFARSDQSDASGVSLTSADLLGFEPGTVKTFPCPVAWGVRTTSDALRAELSTPGGGTTAPGVEADLRALLDDGPGAGEAGRRLATALGQDNTGAARRLARGLVPRLRGLLAAGSRMDPRDPGELAATRLNASVTQFNRFVGASSPAFLDAPPPEMTALHRVLGRLVQSAVENAARTADPDAPVADGALACAPPAPNITPTPTPTPPPLAEVRLCRMRGGRPHVITAQVNPVTGDTMVDGQALAAAFPADEYAAAQAFVTADQAVTLNGRRYVKYSMPRTLAPEEVAWAGEFMGMPVFVAAGTAGTAEVVYLPVRAACEFQPYQLEVKTGEVRGGR
jgi:hypothetical protein